MRPLTPINFSFNNSRLSKRLALHKPAPKESPPEKLASVSEPLLKCNDIKYAQTNSTISPADTTLLLRRQVSLAVQQKNYGQAIVLLDHLITRDPKNADHYANRGLMQYSLHQLEKALADYDQALILNPLLDKVYNNRANLYATQQNWDAAIADYDCAIDINPLNTRARINQAITFREMGNYEEALACLDIAMFFQPTGAVLHAERGRIYHLQGEWNCAIAEYNKALSLIHATDSDNLLMTLSDDLYNQRLRNRILKWISNLK